MAKVTIRTLMKMKERGEKITMLTAYDFAMARIIDAAQMDMILVGDSLGNVILGYDSTIPVTIEDMIHHAKAVRRGTKDAMLVIDMPFLSYQVDPKDAVYNAGRIMKETGAEAVKLEGGKPMVPTIEAIVDVGIPVMGHLGLRPQSIHQLGRSTIQGKTAEQAESLLEDVLALEKAGAFAVVLELVTEEAARYVSERLQIPTIGIGSGAGCDGQVLVSYDMIGMFENISMKFLKKYINLHHDLLHAFKSYRREVKEGMYPGPKNVHKMSDEEAAKLPVSDEESDEDN